MIGEDFAGAIRAANDGLTKLATIKAPVVLDVNSHQLACHRGLNPGLMTI